MSWFTNPIRGAVGNFFVNAKQITSRVRFAPRDLRARGVDLYKQIKELEDIKNKIKSEIKEAHVKGIMDAEGKEVHILEDMRKEVGGVIQDSIMVYHIALDALHELIDEDEDLRKKGFPGKSAKEIEEIILSEIGRFEQDLRAAGDMFRQAA